ncbi:hypothetical protein AD998_11375 [bacterium 336/3]|nr:hypothetical protein AD998_11375 [bacterium 336/3]
MKTSLNTPAYLILIFGILGLILVLILIVSSDNPKGILFNYSDFSISLLLFFAFLGYGAFFLLSGYKEYTFNNKTLIIKNLISKKQTFIDLCDIKKLTLIAKKTEFGYFYHNILVQTKNTQYTLKGLYITEMTFFFNELEKTIKRIS